ncbi:hypothetical protein FEF65_11190 [Mariprofundus erugo]|uniref:Uncharacterized protein n=1 Tax=Mariprofundus erugo TaxID=2528639 RepID=A0A5R9GME3_9PROT|nr:hypothetical protein [Mariprofundus erugo]TLS66149.1 hypothetical protein FEF65_11190 [Mariprofundus erugo]
MQTVCFDIIALNRKQLTLNKCPCCQAELDSRELEPSSASAAFCRQAGKPLVTTSLSTCNGCGWWAVRELREDHAMYHPPVEEWLVMDASKMTEPSPHARKSKDCTAPWEKVLADEGFWAPAVAIPSKDAVLLFGAAQMLLPKLTTPSKDAVGDKIRFLAPILFPLLVILLIALFFS